MIAGDVHIDQSSVVNNNTVNNVSNTTNNVVNNIINQDDTKKVVQCGVCGKQMAVVDALVCKSCGKPVCTTHFHSESEKCSACRDQDIVGFKNRVAEYMAKGVVGIKEEACLEKLAKDLRISVPEMAALRDEVESLCDEISEVTLTIKARGLCVGREPIDDLNELVHSGCGIPSITIDSPKKCYESFYVIDTNYVSEIILDWEYKGVKKHIEPTWAESGSGLRNIKFVQAEQPFGKFNDAKATLFVTETLSTEEYENGLVVTVKLSFKVYGEFEPNKLVIAYDAMSFDDELQRIVSICYHGSELPFEIELSKNDAAKLVHDSWVETVNSNRKLEYNLWVPRSEPISLYNVRVQSNVVFMAVAEFETMEDAQKFLFETGNDRKNFREAMIRKAMESGYYRHGLFLDATDALLTLNKIGYCFRDEKRDPIEIRLRAEFPVKTREECWEVEMSRDPNHYHNVDSMVLSDLEDGKARIIYFELGKGVANGEFFFWGHFDPEKFSCCVRPTGLTFDRNGTTFARMLISSISYDIPSYGKCDSYDIERDHVSEEIFDEDDVEMIGAPESAFYVIERDGLVESFQL